ncbi:hypothetical protein U752_05885 [Streptococcus pseudopneumoniae 1321]|nr:hypothetical protein U752_05885 [Streptococcus pseudopneumoniae 1321]
MLMYVSTEKQDRPIIFKMNSNGFKSLKKLATDTIRNTNNTIVETIFFLSIIIHSIPSQSILSTKSDF